MPKQRQKPARFVLGIITDLHIGRGRNNPVFSNTLIDYIDFVCKEMPNTVKDIIVNGDIFEDGKSMSYFSFDVFTEVHKKLTNRFHRVIYNVGNHDSASRKDNTKNLLSLYRNMTASDMHVVDKWETFDIIDGDDVLNFMVFSYNRYKPDRVQPLTNVVFTHQDDMQLAINGSYRILNGHMHTPSRNLNEPIYNLGVGYQLSVDDDYRDLGFHVMTIDGTLEKIYYNEKAPIYLTIFVKKNQIEGENPIKWLMQPQNRELVQDSGEIFVRVDHETSKTTVEKFNGVLATINSKYTLIDSITSAPDAEISVNQSALDTLKHVLSDIGERYQKAESIYKEAISRQ